jgi:hypothetical protein
MRFKKRQAYYHLLMLSPFTFKVTVKLFPPLVPGRGDAPQSLSATRLLKSLANSRGGRAIALPIELSLAHPFVWKAVSMVLNGLKIEVV